MTESQKRTLGYIAALQATIEGEQTKLAKKRAELGETYPKLNAALDDLCAKVRKMRAEIKRRNK